MDFAVSSASHTVEGIARVVRIDGPVAWMEPEQTTSCGGCAAAASCGTSSAPGIGTVASRNAQRRFALDGNPGGLRVGDRVVVGVHNRALIKASLIAYATPLFTTLAAGVWAQSSWGEDAITMGGMVAGLLFGLLLARVSAARLSARGELVPRYLRRAQPGESCHG